MSQNPFEAPVPQSTGEALSRGRGEIELVSQGKRFVNFLIDRVVMTIATFAAGIVLGVILAVVDPDGTSVPEPAIDIVGFVLGLVVVFGYFVFFEACFQRTPGKFVTGTKVVDENGGRPSFGQILGRSACRFIPFEAFSFLFGDSNRVVGWHDTIPKTRVVKV